MQSPTDKARVVIGVYDAVAELCRPVASLVDLGVQLDQIGVIAPKALLDGARRPAGVAPKDWYRIAGLIADAEKLATPAEMPVILAGGPIARFGSRLVDLASAARNVITTPLGGRSGRSAGTRLEQLICEGHVALAVRAASGE